jgi:MMP 1-O-methyltransferase
MDERLLEIAREAKGFMPEAEGRALHAAALSSPGGHPIVEIGSYCGKSTVYLGAAARAVGATLFTIDHHRGSEEHQPGEGYHDPDLVDRSGDVDTLPELRRTLRLAGMDNDVIVVVGDSALTAKSWSTPLGFVLIDGGHSEAAARADYEGWAPLVVRGGLLAIHDVFEDPSEGGRPPFEIYIRALRSKAFEETASTGSLRVLRRVSDGF